MIAPSLSRLSGPDGAEELQAQVERLVHSELVCGSDALCKLLQFLATRAITQPGEPAREFTLATEVFGRSANFDPQSDSCVRVQVSRLRSKLNQYYAGPGAHDPLILTIPRGAYLLSCERRSSPPIEIESEVLRPTPPRPPIGRRWDIAAVCLVAGLLLGAILVAAARLPIFP